MTARRYALGLSQADVDHFVGWPDSYCEKLERSGVRGGRNIGALSLDEWLAVLGVQLRIEEAEAVRKVQAA
jgi:hypothetical protein